MAIIDQLNSISQEAVDGRVNENFFEVNPWLSLVTGRNMSGTDRGRPGTRDLLGGLRPRSAAERRSVLGSPKKQITVMSSKFGGGAGVGYRGTAPNVTTMDITGALEIPWTLHIQPVKVSKDDVQAGMGDHQIVDIMQRAVDQGVSELEDLVGTSTISGNPASQTAKQLTEYVSIIATLDIDLNAAYLNSSSRVTTDTFLLPALYHDSATLNFDWSLIDDVNKGGGGDNFNPNGGAATLGTGVDLVLCNPTLFYDSILPKARADGHQIISSDGMQELGLVGFRRPVVRYMTSLITYDPHFPATGKDGSSKSYLACLTLKTWEFESHPEATFSIGAWSDLQPNTRERAFGADLELKARLICNKPSANGLYGNVN